MTSVAIAGAGSACCVLAARVSEDPNVRVVVMEAGPDYPTLGDTPDDIRYASRGPYVGSAHDWGYTAQDQAERGDVPVCRGKVGGGSSSVNAAIALRARRSDFDHRASLGNDLWTWEQALPCFRRHEDDAVGGPDQDSVGPVPTRRFAEQELRPLMACIFAACAENGFPVVDDLNTADARGAGVVPINLVAGIRQSTAKCYLKGARQRPNLETRPRVVVDRVLIEDGVARGVVLDNGEWVDADLVVLSAVAIGSPAMLLRSGVGPAADLRQHGLPVLADLPAVVQGLQDQPVVFLTYEADPAAIGDVTIPQQVIVTSSSTGNQETGPIDLHFISRAEDAMFLTVAVGLLTPMSLGWVRLWSSKPADAPRILLNQLDHPEDMRRMLRRLAMARELFSAPTLRKYVRNEVLPGPRVDDIAALVRAAQQPKLSYAHATSTRSMGPDGAPWAVTDQRGRVRGVDALFTVDASIMLAIPASRPISRRSCVGNAAPFLSRRRLRDGPRSGRGTGPVTALSRQRRRMSRPGCVSGRVGKSRVGDEP
jgi:choline dehydrogenase